MTRCKLLVPAAICAVLVGGAGVMSAYTGEELAKDAKVTLPKARAIALKAFPGKITGEELEKEKGWQRARLFLRYQESWRDTRSRCRRQDRQVAGEQRRRLTRRLRLARIVSEMPYRRKAEADGLLRCTAQ